MKNLKYNVLGAIVIGVFFCGVGSVTAMETTSSTESGTETASSTTAMTTTTPTNTTPTTTPQNTTSTTSNVASSTTPLPTTTTTIQIETPDGTLFSGMINFTACDNGSNTSTLNAKCALDALATQQNWTIHYSTFGAQSFLQQVSTYATDFNLGLYWLWFHNDVFASEALNEYIVQENDVLLFTFGVLPMRIVANSSAELYATTTIQAQEFGFDSNFNATWVPATNATFTINNISVTDADGTYELVMTSNTPHVISIQKAGFISASTTITPTLPSRIVHVQFETPSGTLYNDQSVTVQACAILPNSLTFTVHAGCAIEQIAAAQGWTTSINTFGAQQFLQAVGPYVTDFAAGNWWLWFHDLTFASEALNEYQLTNNEHLLFTFGGVQPLRITAATTTPSVSTTVQITGEQFGFDSSFNGVWTLATNATFTTNGIDQTSPSGTLSLDITTTTPYTLSIRKNGFVAYNLTLTPTSTTQIVTTTTPTTQNPTGGCTSCSQGGEAPAQSNSSTEPIDRAIAYLISQQETNGGFGSLLFSDWVAMAYGAYQSSDSLFSTSKQSLTTYLTSSTQQSELQTLTDYERHVLGLRALGQPASQYQQTILNDFDGTQFGITSFVNDDIFAILALDVLGCCQNEIQSAAAFIVSQQDAQTGAIGGSDLTAAAIRALRRAYPNGHTAITNAKQYLQSQQQTDGSIRGGNIDVDTTSWSLDAIGELGEATLSDWFTSQNNTPLSYLLNNQNTDGSFGTQNKVWSTSYAVLALQHSWNPTAPAQQNSNPPGGEAPAQTTSSTTTTDITTTTIDIVTTTIEIVTSTVSTTADVATTTPASATQPNEEATVRRTTTPPSLSPAPAEVASRTTTTTTVTSSSISTTTIPSTPTETLSPASASSTPINNRARNAARTAAAMAGTLGLYLAWRFVQTLV